MIISIFCGGRGSSNIIQSLIRQTNYEINLLVNAYDDGKSTGRLRAHIDGFLGPSDFRKNVSTILESLGKTDVSKFLEYRLLEDIETRSLIKYIEETQSHMLSEFSFSQFETISEALNMFETFGLVRNRPFNYKDCPIGNLILAGLFLSSNHDFNAALTKYQSLFLGEKFRVKIFNVSDGENLYLVARSDSGTIFKEEELIVENPSNERIRQISLIPDKKFIVTEEIFLKPKQPSPNHEAIDAISKSSIIIYGPGTQASSLLPSYLTQGMLLAIRQNTRAFKIFISNLIPDLDDPLADVESRLQAFSYIANLMEGSFSLNHYITNVFSELPLELLKPLYARSEYKDIKFQTDNWLIDGNKHLGPAITRQIGSICGGLFVYKPGFLSIMVRIEKNSKQQNLLKQFMQSFIAETELECEILYDTAPFELTKLHNATGQEVPQFFMTFDEAFVNCRGDVVTILEFPYLYTHSDLLRGIRLLQESETVLILGSRNLRVKNIKSQIMNTYKGEPLRGFIAYIGSLALSISFLVKHNRFITDPLSGIKIFRNPGISDELNRYFSEDVHINILKYFLNHNQQILQYEVDFESTLLSKNNRHGIWDGLKSLSRIWFHNSFKAS